MYVEHPPSVRDKARIRKVIREECANYDYEYGCLPEDAECYMFCIGFKDSSLCCYFEKCILPIHPELMELFNRKPANMKNCLLCGKPFTALGNRKYCSDKCAAAARKKAGRNRILRHREQQCHRSIYNVWNQVLEYFDSFIIGLTATPDKRTFAFFNQNVASEYSREQAIIDGVNVGEDIFLIETQISRNGARLMKQLIKYRDRLTRAKRWKQMDEDLDYTPEKLDK